MTPPVRGPLSHTDLSVSDPDRAIPFYAVFFADPDGAKLEVVYEPTTNASS